MYASSDDANAYRRGWYARNREKVYAANKRYKNAVREWYVALKKTLTCNRCGFADWRALQFHHESDDKENHVSALVARGTSREKVLAEMIKCEVLCANCHHIHHAS